jgi:hypothetical protein
VAEAKNEEDSTGDSGESIVAEAEQGTAARGRLSSEEGRLSDLNGGRRINLSTNVLDRHYSNKTRHRELSTLTLIMHPTNPVPRKEIRFVALVVHR